jgi:hypothetical protein
MPQRYTLQTTSPDDDAPAAPPPPIGDLTSGRSNLPKRSSTLRKCS